MILFLLLVGVFIVLWFLKESYDAKRRPPGPMQFPGVGSMIQVAMQHPIGFLALDKLSKKYGDVMSIKLGTVDYAILSSYDSIKHFYAGEECVDRPCSGIWAERNFYKELGLIFSNGHIWSEIRKFCTQTSRAYGFMNRAWLKDVLREELYELTQHLDEEMKSRPGQVVPFTGSGVVKVSFTNLICSTLSGERHSYSNQSLRDLVISLDKFFRASTQAVGLMMAYPFIRFLFGGALGYDVQLESVKGVNKYTTDLINKHRATGNYKNGEATNFIDAFLQKIDESKNDPKALFTEEQVLITVMDFFTAGAETTANWLLFAMLLLMTHPDKQEKMHKEIQDVLGDRLPEIEDKDKMVYTQAVINEVHRWSKITISLGPRQAVKDLDYKGYTIKKGTTVLANMYPVFHDKAYWGDPQIFRPERFIGPDGKLTKMERLIQFGLGKRICFGELLARDSAFVYLTTLIQRYRMDLPEEYKHKKPSLRLLEGITTCSEDFRVKLVKRI